MSRLKRRRRWVTSRSAGFRCAVHSEVAVELQSALLSRLPWLGEPMTVRRQRRGRTFYSIPTPEGGLFVKRFTLSRYKVEYALKAPLRTLPLRREFTIACRAWNRGVALPRPLAFGEAHRPFRGYDCFLVYRLAPPELKTLADVLPRLGPDQKLPLIDQLGASVFAQHGAGVFHLDLSPLNVLVPECGTTQVMFVDWENSVIGPPRHPSYRERSLHRLRAKFSPLGDFDLHRFRAAYQKHTCGEGQLV